MPADADSGRSDDDWLVRRTRYRRLSMGSLLAGIAGFVIADAAGAVPAAIGVYWLGIVGFFAVRRAAPMALFDERDLTIERRASHDALRVAGAALVVGAPAAGVLERTGRLTVPPVVDGAVVGVAATFGVFGLAGLARRYA